MITAQYAAKQIIRLAGLRFFPSAITEAQDELMIALQFAAASDEHAREIITDIIRESIECPTPAHIYALKPRDTSNPRGTNPYGDRPLEWER